MLTGAFCFLLIAIIAAYFEYKELGPTSFLLAKIILYFAVVMFFALLITYIFNSVPPIPQESSSQI